MERRDETRLGDGPHVSDVGGDLRDVGTQLGTLVRDHVELARAEMVTDVKKALRDVGLAGAGAFLAVLGWVLLMVCVSLAIGLALGNWAGFLIVGGVHALLGGILVLVGVGKLKGKDKPRLDETARTLRDDKAFATRMRDELREPVRIPRDALPPTRH